MMKRIILAGFIFIALGCNKFLDEKPDGKLAVPNTVEDFQALLDFDNNFNNSSALGSEGASDDYYLTTADWLARGEEDRNMYVWAESHVFERLGTIDNDWNRLYKIVFITNACIEGIDKIGNNGQNTESWNNVKGSALFYRAKAFLQGAFVWTKAYDESTAQNDLGMPIRRGSDFNVNSVRASVKETYEQVIADLRAAADLLPVNPVSVVRPSKAAAYALLARTYLAMRRYDDCFNYADLYLKLKSSLIDFNGGPGINLTAPVYKFERFNQEVIHETTSPPTALITNARAKIDSVLYLSYQPNDLRKTIFFQGTTGGAYRFNGSYKGSIALFDGIATDELYLMRAECYARKGLVTEAMTDLNTLMIKRWKAGTFVPFAAANATEAVNIILKERRKELIFRNLRWMDIKRLNKEGANITLIRKINNQTYTLPPNDPRYAMAIPEDVIETSKIVQNPR